MLKKEFSSNRKVYREIFLKTKNEFLALVDNFKGNYTCINCGKCSSIIYKENNPAEIQTIINSEGDNYEYWLKFSSIYSPYGYEEAIDWFDIDYDQEKNHIWASKINNDYVKRVKKIYPDATFYFLDKYKSLPENLPGFPLAVSYLEYPQKLLTMFHKNCSYYNWQLRVREFLETDLSKQIYTQVNKIDEYRKQFACSMTGTCCRLSSSEHSYEELKERAQQGDKFAQEFTSVFIPFNNQDEARNVFPEYVDYVLEEFVDDNIYFYHCPHIDKNNLCTRYEDRPGICRDFPSNPLAIMFPGCGYIKWKKETIITALTSHAMIEITIFTLDKLNQIINVYNNDHK